MILFEFALDGFVSVYELSASRFILRAGIDAAARAQTVPKTLDEAKAFQAGRCHQFEAFDEIDDAETWADSYQGFRANEARAEFRRFLIRKAAIAERLLIAA